MDVKTVKGHFFTEFEQALSLALHNDFKPDLALVFCSVSQNLNQVSKLFHDNGIEFLGATTAGEIFEDEVDEKSIVAMLMKLPHHAYSKVYRDRTDDKTTLHEVGLEIGQGALSKYKNPSVIVLSGGMRANGEELVNGLLASNVPGNNIFGALAGDDLRMQNTYVFTNEGITNIGVAALILDGDKISVSGIATSGWESIGTEKIITKSKGNVVYGIDNTPAIDVFLKYFDKSKERLMENDLVVNELAQYPLHVMRENDHRVLRAPLLADQERGALVFSGTVEQGARIKFSIPPGFETIESTTQDIIKMKDSMPEADALIMFSCKARHQALGPLVVDEVESVRNTWNAPLIGFFSYGEIGSTDDHTCDFHNETISLVVLKEL
ncbi:MAG: FIST signal transduction protein [Bacteroidota bacterium]